MQKVLPNVGERRARELCQTKPAGPNTSFTLSQMVLMLDLVIERCGKDSRYNNQPKDENEEVGPGSCRK